MAARRASPVLLAALAGALHLVLDGLTSRLTWTTPPYLLLDHAGELGRTLLEFGRGPVLGTVAVTASIVNGIVAALMAVALEAHPRRRALLVWTLFGLWVAGGAMMALAYLSAPWLVLAGSLAAGLPRSWLVAWALVRALPAPSTGATPAGHE
jgi:hypothetical protein